MSPYSYSLKLLVCCLMNVAHSGPTNYPHRTNKEQPLINEIDTGKDAEGRQDKSNLINLKLNPRLFI